MKNKIFKNMEWWILISAIILSIVGFVAIYSASQQIDPDIFKKQMIWFGISIVVLIITMLTDYEMLSKVSPIFYVISLISLGAVMLFSHSVNGAKSWFDLGFFKFQPAEFAKISVILFLATVMVKVQERDKREINVFWKLLIVLSVVLVPVGLIILQPDYGTAAAFIVATILMLFVSGIDRKYIIIAMIVVAIVTPLGYRFLPDHAKKRIEIFLHPESDPKGSGYNVLQSKIAIGAGELTGMGILNGNQTQMGYLSPKTTDFIYSVIGEEMGFVIAGAVVLVYVTLITRSLYVAKTAKDDLGSYIAAGISGVFLFHMAENIGMTLGLLPITGVPLLFISYGGSSMITSFICIGLLLNISGNRKKTIFIK